MTQQGDVRALASRGNDGADGVLRIAEDVARVTLVNAEAEAERIRAAARMDAAKIRAKTEAEARQFEGDLRTAEAEIAALGRELASLEALNASLAAQTSKEPIIPAMARLRWDECAADSEEFGPERVAGRLDLEAALEKCDDASTVERFMGELEVERNRLQREIAAANRRMEMAPSQGSARAAVERELGAVVLAAYDELAAIEREHRDAIGSVRGDARADAARILDAAREQATAVHARAERLAEVRAEEPEPGVSR